jgi:hypothetical protein
MSQRAHLLPALPPQPTAPRFFSTMAEMYRWQLEQLGPPESWPTDERAELESLSQALQARLRESE